MAIRGLPCQKFNGSERRGLATVWSGDVRLSLPEIRRAFYTCAMNTGQVIFQPRGRDNRAKILQPVRRVMCQSTWMIWW